MDHKHIDKYKVAAADQIEGIIADGTFGRCLKVSYDGLLYAAKVEGSKVGHKAG